MEAFILPETQLGSNAGRRVLLVHDEKEQQQGVTMPKTIVYVSLRGQVFVWNRVGQTWTASPVARAQVELQPEEDVLEIISVSVSIWISS